MAFSVPEVAFPMSNRSFPDQEGGVYDELNLLSIERHHQMLVKKESMEKERQISVDPISLREPSFNLMLPPVVTSQRDVNTVPLPPMLPPAKHKFLSCSLPNSATSSPRFSSILSKKKWKSESQASPRQVGKLVHQHSVANSRLSLLQENLFQRSKSCGERRVSAPSANEFDLCLNKPNAIEFKNVSCGSFSKAEMINKDIQKSTSSKKMDSHDEEFKCGALCLFLPGFGKAKAVRPRKEEELVVASAVIENVISRTVSLEKFECGSWASSALVNDHDEDGDSMNLYFDLPLELIKSNLNDAHSPINAAFVFDKDRKGVLKTGSSRSMVRKSHESPRHVRFSVSSPTCPESPASCITPRLRKAREDFNAFLEAQSA
ncbi:hypothetical protein Ddye_029857 [Dipteronia dyeriana]|uniref:Uncharacterized protein n=1 Tax=Dipteronia dyeriana TaxID=168575 RepID=A0AAD9TGI0_9ROSI|nr:hypothetical protein Ddye_029857 [Dipteronia dyeriana]